MFFSTGILNELTCDTTNATTDMVGVEHAPATPAPQSPTVKGSAFPSMSTSGSKSRSQYRPTYPHPYRSSTNMDHNRSFPAEGASTYASNNNKGAACQSNRVASNRATASNSLTKLRPEQLTAAAARAAAHNASVSASYGAAHSHYHPPAERAVPESLTTDEILSSMTFETSHMAPLTPGVKSGLDSSNDSLRDDVGDGNNYYNSRDDVRVLTPLPEIRGSRGALLPTPTLIAPAPHLPPPPIASRHWMSTPSCDGKRHFLIEVSFYLSYFTRTLIKFIHYLIFAMLEDVKV